MADDLAAFVAARLDEREAGAWSVHDVATCDALLYEANMAAYAAARDPYCDCGQPACVRREVAAMRAILAECEPRPGAGVVGIEVAQRYTLRHLAAVWSDHPGYRQEWAPAPATLAP